MNIPDLVNLMSPNKSTTPVFQNTASSDDDITDTTTPSTPPVDETPSTTSASSASDDTATEFDTFLRLLTAQIQNQDPLAPLDSTQFVEQLATFSQLELQAATNNKLDEIARLLAEQGYGNSNPEV